MREGCLERLDAFASQTQRMRRRLTPMYIDANLLNVHRHSAADKMSEQQIN